MAEVEVVAEVEAGAGVAGVAGVAGAAGVGGGGDAEQLGNLNEPIRVLQIGPLAAPSVALAMYSLEYQKVHPSGSTLIEL